MYTEKKLEKQTSQRNVGMDVIRCFALLCVISVHLFLNAGFYDQTVAGVEMHILMLVRNFFMICVPLFILLSGYLLNQKAVSLKYYLRIIPILSIYLLSCCVCVLYRIWINGEVLTIGGVIRQIFCYEAAPYGWYIEMYIGLFLLIPFLNILYHHIALQKHKKYLIATMLFLTAGIGLINDFFVIFPDFWESLYPVTYYFIGCYLKEYPLKLKRATRVLLFIGLFLISGSISYLYFYGQLFQWNNWQKYGSAINTIQAVLVFDFLAHRNYTHCGTKTRKLLSYISKWSLGAYLVSWIFDNFLYCWILNNYQPTFSGKMLFFVPIVLVVYVCSSVLSGILNGLYNVTIGKLLSRFIAKYQT